MTKLFFATDIHGSDICWSKFLNAGKFYGADVLILGGDGYLGWPTAMQLAAERNPGYRPLFARRLH